MTEFLPDSVLAPDRIEGSHVQFMSADATLNQKGKTSLDRYAPYDRILIDAPCSSDRHLIRGGQLSKWSSGLSKVNAERQLSLLMNAIWLLAPGGTILYSTCS